MEISNPPDYKSSIDKFPHRRALPFDQAQDLRLAPVFALGVADGFALTSQLRRGRQGRRPDPNHSHG